MNVKRCRLISNSVVGLGQSLGACQNVAVRAPQIPNASSSLVPTSCSFSSFLDSPKRKQQREIRGGCAISPLYKGGFLFVAFSWANPRNLTLLFLLCNRDNLDLEAGEHAAAGAVRKWGSTCARGPGDGRAGWSPQRGRPPVAPSLPTRPAAQTPPLPQAPSAQRAPAGAVALPALLPSFRNISHES
jgi:hypothetical protein